MARILIVDDDPFIKLSVEKYLRSFGHEVFTAENGQEGLALVKEHSPDLILLDLMMPVMDGVTFLDKLRNELGQKDVPVIALTAVAQRSSVMNVLRYGVKDYVTKPFNPNSLLLKVRKVVESPVETSE